MWARHAGKHFQAMRCERIKNINYIQFGRPCSLAGPARSHNASCKTHRALAQHISLSVCSPRESTCCRAAGSVRASHLDLPELAHLDLPEVHQQRGSTLTSRARADAQPSISRKCTACSAASVQLRQHGNMPSEARSASAKSDGPNLTWMRSMPAFSHTAQICLRQTCRHGAGRQRNAGGQQGWVARGPYLSHCKVYLHNAQGAALEHPPLQHDALTSDDMAKKPHLRTCRDY